MLRYLIEWTGYENTNEQFTWVGADDIDAVEHLNSFYCRYPDKPGPEY
jgi:hypothetical protein